MTRSNDFLFHAGGNCVISSQQLLYLNIQMMGEFCIQFSNLPFDESELIIHGDESLESRSG